jgi:hypothetical protein
MALRHPQFQIGRLGFDSRFGDACFAATPVSSPATSRSIR